MEVVISLCIFAVFACVAIADTRTGKIHNPFSYALLILGIIKCLWHKYPIGIALLNGFCAFLLFLSIGLFTDWLLRRKGESGGGLGGGDIKLLSATGFTLGLYPALLLSCIAFGTAAVYNQIRNKQVRTMPVGVRMGVFFLIGYIVILTIELWRFA